MKKTIALTLSAFLLMTGCSNGSDAGTEETDAGEKETVELNTDAQETELETIDVARYPGGGSSAFEAAYISTSGYSTPYEPSVMFYADGTFVFTENLYAGMGTYKGTYEFDDKSFTCTVKEVEYTGVKGDDVKTIKFSRPVFNQLRLETELCGSYAGDIFIYVNPYKGVGKFVSTADFSDPYKPAVTFADDGTFVFTENLYEGMGEYSGAYLYDGNQYRCKVESANFKGFKGDDVKEIVFHVSGDDIMLGTDLCASAKFDYFTAKDFGPEQSPVAKTYRSVRTDYSKGCEPSIMFYADGTYAFTGNMLAGMYAIWGSYKYNGTQFVCTVESTNYDYGVKEITFTNIGDCQVRLDTGLIGSDAGDIFSFVSIASATGTFISTRTDFTKGCEPTVSFYIDGTFEMTENLLAGMGKYKGIFQYDGNLYRCQVRSVDFKGFAGDSVSEIVFYDSGKELFLNTDLCGSVKGDAFAAGGTSVKPPVTSTEKTGTVFIVEGADSNRIKVRKSPGLSGADTGERKYSGEKVTVYEQTEKDGYTWYRIGTDRWMAGNGTSFGIKFD